MFEPAGNCSKPSEILMVQKLQVYTGIQSSLCVDDDIFPENLIH